MSITCLNIIVMLFVVLLSSGHSSDPGHEYVHIVLVLNSHCDIRHIAYYTRLEHIPTHLVRSVWFIPLPGGGRWFGVFHFTLENHRIAHIADNRLVVYLVTLRNW